MLRRGGHGDWRKRGVGAALQWGAVSVCVYCHFYTVIKNDSPSDTSHDLRAQNVEMRS